MESEKVKEIKKALECCQSETPNCIDCAYWGNCKKDYGAKIRSDILTLIKELEQTNETLKNELSTYAKMLGQFGYNDIKECEKLEKRIKELEKENETLRNAKVVYETVDYCAEDLRKAQERIAELEDKIENGTLIELPCKVGDKIWYISMLWRDGKFMGEIYDANVSGFYVSNGFIQIEDDIIYHYHNYGEDVFITKAEAEKKLKEFIK